jgi:hypothetical protein
MRPDPRFVNRQKAFWACVRSISQHIGYTVRGQNRVKAPTVAEMRGAFPELDLHPAAIADERGQATELATQLEAYFIHRANTLESIAARKLMNATEAQATFEDCRRRFMPSCPLPLNKQKGTKKAPAFLTGLVNMMIETHSGGASCDYDPRKLTTVTRDGVPLRTLARRVDGAFPASVNPVAVWEVKEYYYTTTFGSRVADGVYETLLDRWELEEFREECGVDIKHYLMVDAYDTWWCDGKAYLCRIVDMLHMGYVDEVLFGREVVEEMPRIVREWVRLAADRRDRVQADPPATGH